MTAVSGQGPGYDGRCFTSRDHWLILFWLYGSLCEINLLGLRPVVMGIYR